MKHFVEVDFANITTRKCHYIRNNIKLLQGLQSGGNAN